MCSQLKIPYSSNKRPSPNYNPPPPRSETSASNKHSLDFPHHSLKQSGYKENLFYYHFIDNSVCNCIIRLRYAAPILSAKILNKRPGAYSRYSVGSVLSDYIITFLFVNNSFTCIEQFFSFVAKITRRGRLDITISSFLVSTMNIDMLPMKLAFLTHGLLYYNNNNNNNVTEKLSKYKDLELEIERMWGVKATTIPVVIGALGLIKKGLEKYIQQITGNIKRRSHYLHRSEERHSNRLLPKRG